MSSTQPTAGHHDPGTSRYADIPGVALQVSRDLVVASIQVDLEEDVVSRFREELLGRIHETGSRGVILDLSGLDTMDSAEFSALRNIIRMTAIMGAESVLVGLRPGVVSALIEAGADVDGLRSALDLDAAFALLQPEPEPDCNHGTDVSAATETDLDTDQQDEQLPESNPVSGL